MHEDNRVSIIMPAYNAERFIGEAVESVQAQGFENWELLVADDRSTDRTVAIVKSIALNDPRVRVLISEKNGGPAAARNLAIQSAGGRYIAFLDSDDVWLPQKLETQLEFMRSSNTALTYTRYRRIDEDGIVVGHLVSVPSQLNYQQLLRNTAIVTSTVMIDRSLVGDFHMKHTYYDDYALWLEIVRRGFVAKGLRQDLTRYRVVGNSVSRKKGKSALMVWRTYRDVENLGLLRSMWSFSGYIWNAICKYRRF